MKRLVSIFLVLILIGIASYFLLSNNAGQSQSILNRPGNSNNETIIQPKNGKPLENGITVTNGYTISIFAEGLGSARDLEFSPEGTLLVSSPSNDTVYALPDQNNDGIADAAKTVLTDTSNLHGIAFHKGKLYVASTNIVKRYTWNEESLTASNPETILTLPGGGNHSSRSIVFDNNDNLYISIGSTCNVCFEDNEWITTVIKADEDGKNARVFAKGLRNAPFLTKNPETGDIWVTEMGRDLLGDNLPPDEVNILRENGDYGYPICYGNKIYDRDFGKSSASYCQNTIAPVFAVPAHNAPLGLTFVESSQFPSDWQGDLLVAYHGSWNRSIPDGYKVVKIDVSGNTTLGSTDIVTGFIQNEEVIGRPVDVIISKDGTLYISDDKSGIVYKVTRS